MAAHRLKKLRENADGEYIALCACGWESDSRPMSDMARELLERHLEEAQEASAAPELARVASVLDRALAAASRPGTITVELTPTEARALRRLLPAAPPPGA